MCALPIFVISPNGKALQIQFSKTAQLLGDLEHWQHDTFIVRWRDRGLNADAFLTFSLDPDGKIVQALMVPISPRTDFSFDFQDLRLAPETGSASCWERVCQYVYISVVAVSLKQQTTQHNP